jgi:teichuronic acid biosynthesis glycosyltransferase TuaC
LDELAAVKAAGARAVVTSLSSPSAFPRALRVLVVTNMYPSPKHPSYGAFVATQVRSLSNAGVTVEVDFINGRRAMAAYAVAPRRISRLARSGRFDLVHAHYGVSGWAAMFQDLPLVISYVGDDLLGTPRRGGHLTVKSRISRTLGLMAARRAAALICVSENLRTALSRPEDQARAHVIPLGVDTALFTPGDRQAARTRLGVAQDERLVLFPNTPTEPRKRLDLAEAAMARLNAVGVSARLWVVTGVAYSEMPDYFRAADCLLLTSDWEGSPMVVREALSTDLPVVSVDAGDVRLWLDRVPGCRLVARDPEAIAQGLAAVLRQGGRIDGRPIRTELAIDRVTARVLDVYRDVLRDA